MLNNQSKPIIVNNYPTESEAETETIFSTENFKKTKKDSIEGEKGNSLIPLIDIEKFNSEISTGVAAQTWFD